jgi:hypothetical protein
VFKIKISKNLMKKDWQLLKKKNIKRIFKWGAISERIGSEVNWKGNTWEIGITLIVKNRIRTVKTGLSRIV